MKKTIISFLVLFSFIISVNAQSYKLIDVVYKGSNGINSTSDVKADKYGGTLVSDRVVSNDCRGDYHVKWSFSTDISTLRNGDEFTVYTECADCTSTCGFRKAVAFAGRAGNITSIPGYSGYTYNGNIEVVSNTIKSGNQDSWYNGYTKHSHYMKTRIMKNSKYTAFNIVLGNHMVYYVYEYSETDSNNSGIGYRSSSTSSSTKQINCLQLVTVGQLVGQLSVGAYEGYGYSWMVKAIDYALDHIKATNCMSPDYLRDLRKRINYAPDTKIFYNEIEVYFKGLYEEVGVSCAACKQCPD